MSVDPRVQVHRDWLGTLQPVGLVVSPHALVQAQLHPTAPIAPLQAIFQVLTPGDRLDDLPALCEQFLGWQASDLAEPPPEATLALPEYEDHLAPSWVVPAFEGDRWLLLVRQEAAGTELDRAVADGWRVSPQARFERLLRESGVLAGLLGNGDELRLVVAPSGESAGHLSFPVPWLRTVAGRPALAALHMLLCAERLFVMPDGERLEDVLRASRQYQSKVTTALAGQVLGALEDLLRGFEAADRATEGRLLGQALDEDPDHVYGGLLTTLLRLVFLLYAEDRGLMPSDPLYVNHYSVGGLFERLRGDGALYPDTMDQRFGAWSGLLTLFRLVFRGGGHGGLRLPARQGRLFNPASYPFLEGRPYWDPGGTTGPLEVPRISDGVILRVLEALLVLDGERLSYRALDVEQIGSVYEAVMGFSLGRARGVSVGVRPDSAQQSARIVVDLDALLEQPSGKRARWLKEQSGCGLARGAATALRRATTVAEVLEALGRRAVGRTVPAGGLYLQPTDERRRSGSHYTPRALSEPIVTEALAPLLADLGPEPRAEQLLGLRVLDPAMGSGAFLVTACRLLAEQVAEAWRRHGLPPELDEGADPLLHAQRRVAQSCLYGVDRNPFAVDLARLSLWLVTLAADKPFTFLDANLRCGDSLVGLSRDQIADLHWQRQAQLGLFMGRVTAAVQAAGGWRRELGGLPDEADAAKRLLLRDADDALDVCRGLGDLAVGAFFAAGGAAGRNAAREQHLDRVRRWLDEGHEESRTRCRLDRERVREQVAPFHWELEFPEVFSGGRAGFDCVVGNPPFLGGRNISHAYGKIYRSWLTASCPGASGGSDLVAYFFRRAYALLRPGGTFGLIATNTIAQGDTRASGLRPIRNAGGTIYRATRRVKWPGLAAVVVSVVHVRKGAVAGPAWLDGREVERITAYLFHDGGDEDPARLRANSGQSFQGTTLLGMGFTFDDGNEDASPLPEMERLIGEDPRNGERIFPFLGGREVNESPVHAPRRHVIDFGDMTLEEAQRWPALVRLVEEKVRPRREAGSKEVASWPWWRFWRHRAELYSSIQGLPRVLVQARVSQMLATTWLPAGYVFSDQLIIFALPVDHALALLQSRPHEIWARFFGSSLEDRLRYTPTDCYETFPFPPNWQTNPTLEAAGAAYHTHRAALMVANDQGLTATYNRFHDPDELDPGILELRRLHDAMDRAVLDAYGWKDLTPTCEFLLDHGTEADFTGRRRAPWRYRWPDDVHDEVLARLLALNAQRARDEALAGGAGQLGLGFGD